jgi:beta-N-acetylhexosaminidase
MAATAKHFPGDGIDERDSHVCTSINDLSETEWMESYGTVWRGVIDAGVKTIMSGHIALPWAGPGKNYLGPMPATLSKELQIDLLRKRLGFKGVVISDATPMIGYSAMAGKSTRNVLNIQTGSDMVLWLNPEEETVFMKEALETGLLSEERLETAVKNILGLKLDMGLLDGKEPPPSPYTVKDFQSWADAIGEKSITIVRNENNLLPLDLKAGAKLLTVTICFDEDTRGYVQDLSIVDEELRARGFEVDHLERPSSKELNEAASSYDAVFMNVHVMPRYGTTRFFGNATACLWDSFWPEHARVVFTSFGDPYKFWEMPYCPNFINTFSNTPSSQKAAVKVWLGEIEAQGRSPVRCKGFFEIEVR